jgi:hypothetical protein
MTFAATGRKVEKMVTRPMKRLLGAFSLLTALSCANVAHASSVTLDFNTVFPPNWYNAMTEDGFTLATSETITLHFGTGNTSCTPSCADNGTVSARLFDDNDATTAIFDLVEVGGGTFQFLGFDLGEGVSGFPQFDATSVTVTGYLSSAVVNSQTFVLDTINDGTGGLADFQSFVAVGFGNVDRLVFVGNGVQKRFSMDNVLLDTDGVTSAVPEGGTSPLLILGLAGLILLRQANLWPC